MTAKGVLECSAELPDFIPLTRNPYARVPDQTPLFIGQLRAPEYMVNMSHHPTPDETSDAAFRTQLRKTALAQRRLQKKNRIATWSAALHAHLLAQWPQAPGRVIGFCWPIDNEPDLRPLLEHWALTQLVTAALPVVVDPRQPLAFRPWHTGAAMVTDRYGIPTPADGDFVQPDVLLIPLNAFDAQGFRIGYGGGFFDRTLSSLQPRPLAIGVGFEISRVDSTRPQPHDQRMDWIVTEAACFKC